jgi:hypothetical protein
MSFSWGDWVRREVAQATPVSPAGWMLGGLAFFGGSLFRSAGLLVMSLQTGGDVRRMLPGGSRAWR